MNRIRLVLCAAAAVAVTSVYAVLPFAAGLRHWLGGLLLPMAAGAVFAGACGVRIVLVLRRLAPFTVDSVALLAMPVLEPGSAPGRDDSEAGAGDLLISDSGSNRIHLAAMTGGSGSP